MNTINVIMEDKYVAAYLLVVIVGHLVLGHKDKIKRVIILIYVLLETYFIKHCFCALLKRTALQVKHKTLIMNESSENSTFEMEEIDEEHLRILMSVVPIVVPIIFTLVIIIGFVGNLLVVLVVILNKKMRNTTNILIFNLAVSRI